MLDRSTGDDKPVIAIVAYLVKAFVESEHMLRGGIFRHMAAHLDKVDVNVERGVAKEPE